MYPCAYTSHHSTSIICLELPLFSAYHPYTHYAHTHAHKHLQFPPHIADNPINLTKPNNPIKSKNPNTPNTTCKACPVLLGACHTNNLVTPCIICRAYSRCEWASKTRYGVQAGELYAYGTRYACSARAQTHTRTHARTHARTHTHTYLRACTPSTFASTGIYPCNSNNKFTNDSSNNPKNTQV